MHLFSMWITGITVHEEQLHEINIVRFPRTIEAATYYEPKKRKRTKDILLDELWTQAVSFSVSCVLRETCLSEG